MRCVRHNAARFLFKPPGNANAIVIPCSLYTILFVQAFSVLINRRRRAINSANSEGPSAQLYAAESNITARQTVSG